MGAAVYRNPPAGHVPVQAPRLLILKPIRVQGHEEGGAGRDDVADGALLDKLLRLDDLRPVLGVLGEHEHSAGLLGGGENAVTRRQRGRHRLLQDDVLAGRKGLDSQRLVQVVGRQDVHGVEVAVSQPLLQRAEHLGARLGRDLSALARLGSMAAVTWMRGACSLMPFR